MKRLNWNVFVSGGLCLLLCGALSACKAPSGAPDGASSEASSAASGGSSAPSSAVSAPEFDGDALKKQSLAYMEQFRGGDFSAAYEAMTDEVKAQITIDQLAQTWDTLSQVAGSYKSPGETDFGAQGEYGVVTVNEPRPIHHLLAVFAYDAAGRIAGVNFNALPVKTQPQSSDKWEEIPVQLAGEQPLDGLLTLPKGVEKPPVAVLIHGSGQSNMDEAIGAAPNRPFADIAHGLAEQGVATLRYDKRYYAYSPESVEITIQQEVLDDAAAAIQLMAADSRVNGGRILVIGHSLGGMLAPQIAKDNPQVKGIVSLAGTLRGMEDLMLDQNKAVLAQETTLDEETKALLLEQVEAEVQKVKGLAPDSTDAPFGMPALYWNSLNAIDSAAIVKALDIPMLILQGENDFQVYPDVDYPLWQTTLAGKSNAAFRLYPGLSHLFMPAKDSTPDVAVYDAPTNVEPQVIRDIAEWIAAIQ